MDYYNISGNPNIGAVGNHSTGSVIINDGSVRREDEFLKYIQDNPRISDMEKIDKFLEMKESTYPEGSDEKKSSDAIRALIKTKNETAVKASVLSFGGVKFFVNTFMGGISKLTQTIVEAALDRIIGG